MPYIDQKFRDKLNPAIDELVEVIRNIDAGAHDGRLGTTNYSITRLLLGVFLWHQSYANFLAATGTLEMVKQELYRRMAAPYEDCKRDERGEVY